MQISNLPRIISLLVGASLFVCAEANLSAMPSLAPTAMPSSAPTSTPNVSASAPPSSSPSIIGSASPSDTGSASPSTSPTDFPSISPTDFPSISPTDFPSAPPSAPPTMSPSAPPSMSPSAPPSMSPTASPTSDPTESPTQMPTSPPTKSPIAASQYTESNTVLTIGYEGTCLFDDATKDATIESVEAIIRNASDENVEVTVKIQGVMKRCSETTNNLKYANGNRRLALGDEMDMLARVVQKSLNDDTGLMLSSTQVLEAVKKESASLASTMTAAVGEDVKVRAITVVVVTDGMKDLTSSAFVTRSVSSGLLGLSALVVMMMSF